MDKKQISLLNICDLSKASDSVKHTLLLKKLLKINIDTDWFDSYLSNRTQSVRVNDTISSKLNVDYGGPQGSILGPLLFNIFVPEFIGDCTLVQYADDTQLLHSGSLDDLKLVISRKEETMRISRAYFLRQGLMMIANKTQCIFIGTRQLLSKIPLNVKIELQDDIIEPVINVKNLGVFLDR